MSTPENVERVRDLLQQNCQITVRMFCELLYISKTACHRILPVDPGNPAVLIKFSCALFSFVLLQLDVCRLLFSNCEQLIVCGSEWNFGTSPVLSAATLHSTGWPTTYGPRQYYQLLHSILQGDPRLMDITAGDDFVGLCDQKRSYKHVPDFGRLQNYGCLELRIECQDYWK